MIPLQLSRTLVSSSFGIFDSLVDFPDNDFFAYASCFNNFRTILLVDPTSFEEPLLATTITIITDEIGQLVSVSQLGPSISSQNDVLSKCILFAKARTVELAKQIESI
jgi:exosome complex component RRP43